MSSKFIKLLKIKKGIWYFSLFLILFSLIGILSSSFYKPIKKPINLGMDFVGAMKLELKEYVMNLVQRLQLIFYYKRLKIFQAIKLLSTI